MVDGARMVEAQARSIMLDIACAQDGLSRTAASFHYAR